MKCLYLKVQIFLVFLLFVFGKDERVPPSKDEIPFISCEVCEKSITEIYSQVSLERSKSTKGKLEEIVIVNILESICDAQRNSSAQWIRKLDIVETSSNNNRFLTLKEFPQMSKCGKECSTIMESCSRLYGETFDLDQVSSTFWKNKLTLPELQKKACQSWTKVCSKKNYPKPLPSSMNRQDTPFLPMTEKEIEMEKLMSEMRAAGLGGGMSLHTPDELASMYDFDDESEVQREEEEEWKMNQEVDSNENDEEEERLRRMKLESFEDSEF